MSYTRMIFFKATVRKKGKRKYMNIPRNLYSFVNDSFVGIMMAMHTPSCLLNVKTLENDILINE